MAFSNPIVGGENGELIRASIQSPDYVAGVSGWTINRDGSAEFNNVTIRFELGTGSIVVGPPTGPQVVIRIFNGVGMIQFPTNTGEESTPASIQSMDSTDEALLQIESSFASGSASSSRLRLWSGNDAIGSPIEPVAQLSAFGSQSSNLNVWGTFTYLDTPEFFVGNEIRVSDDNADGNYPIRVVSGKVFTGTTDTTISNASDTLITDAGAATTYLVNGAAYSVEVQVPTRSSSGTSASGTQAIMWKLWDGAVGGTQLANTLRKVTDSVGSSFSITSFKFVFEFTGTTGSRTINLSAIQNAGTDTLQARVNTQYHMLVNRIGDPALINNL